MNAENSCPITTRRITLRDEEADWITASMQPDSREPPRLRERNYSHNISPSLHCKKPPRISSHHSNFPGAFMYEEVFRDGYKLHAYSTPLQTLALPSSASSHSCSSSVIKACPFPPFGIPSCSLGLSCRFWRRVTRGALCACSPYEGHTPFKSSA